MLARSRRLFAHVKRPLLLLPNAAASSASSSRSPTHMFEDIVGWMRAERAEDLRALDVRDLLGGAIGETFVFGTGRSKPHMLRIAKAVQYELKHRGALTFNKVPVIEGKAADDWMVIDGGSVIVSVMVPDARARLALEDHWEAQGAVPIDLPPEDDHVTSLPAVGLPGETLASGEIPAPPAHWGAAPGVAGSKGAPLEDVYREDDSDDALLLDDTDAGDDDDLEEYEYAYEEYCAHEEYYEDEYEEYQHDEYQYDDYQYDDYQYDEYYEDEKAPPEEEAPPPPPPPRRSS